jgi:hypothetical protein
VGAATNHAGYAERLAICNAHALKTVVAVVVVVVAAEVEEVESEAGDVVGEGEVDNGGGIQNGEQSGWQRAVVSEKVRWS